MTESAEHFKQ